MHEQEIEPLPVPAADYHQLAERLDERTLAAAYVGRWASREAFGLDMLDDTGARSRLELLPRWLQPYVRLDGDAFVADLEKRGIYAVEPVASSVYVFDASALRYR